MSCAGPAAGPSDPGAEYATVPLEDSGLGCCAHVTGLRPGTQHAFRVVAVNSCGASQPSAPGGPCCSPGFPTPTVDWLRSLPFSSM